MSASNGNGGYSQVSDHDRVTRREFVDQEEKLDALLDDHRILDGKLTGLAAKSTSHSAAIAEVNSVVKGHSEMLANIGSAVIRIEASLKATAEKVERVEDIAEEADEKAVRASWTNETDRELAATYVEERKLSLAAKKNEVEAKAKRQEVVTSAWSGAFQGAAAGIKAVGAKALPYVAIALGIGIAVWARSCNVPMPTLP